MALSLTLSVFQGIMPGSVTHHPGLFVTYHSGSHRPLAQRLEARMNGNKFKANTEAQDCSNVPLHTANAVTLKLDHKRTTLSES